jgi:hypothetical protein
MSCSARKCPGGHVNWRLYTTGLHVWIADDDWELFLPAENAMDWDIPQRAAYSLFESQGWKFSWLFAVILVYKITFLARCDYPINCVLTLQHSKSSWHFNKLWTVDRCAPVVSATAGRRQRRHSAPSEVPAAWPWHKMSAGPQPSRNTGK